MLQATLSSLSHFFNGESQEQASLVIGNPERVEAKAERVSTLADPLLHHSIRFRINSSEGNVKYCGPNKICSIVDVPASAGYTHLNRSHNFSALFVNAADS